MSHALLYIGALICFNLGVCSAEGAAHRALAPHFFRPLWRPQKSSVKGSIANAGPVHGTWAMSGLLFGSLMGSFPAGRKIVQKKSYFILPVKEKGLYICTPQ
ncbi:hypothetical protein, partial [Gelidibacter pelagius]